MRRIQLGIIVVIFVFFNPMPLTRASSGPHFKCEASFASVETQQLRKIKDSITYPDIPPVSDLHIASADPKPVSIPKNLSAGLTDPVLEQARDLHAFEDFKYLSDLSPKKLSPQELESIRARAHKMVSATGKSGKEAERASLKFFIEAAYQPGGRLERIQGIAGPEWTVHTGNSKIDAAFDYTERDWSELTRKPVALEKGSLLESPYPVLIPAGRFQESYYWDSYFGAKGLLATGRLELAKMQVENLLSSVRRYGFVPNGGRDYYLSRSQPPMLSSLVRDVYDASLASATPVEKIHLNEWLKKRAYPLLQRDYANFWMNPNTRYDVKTGLNHHWDELNLPRPERHGSDQEHALGRTYRDVRAAAESGLDFTDTFQGETSHIDGVLLNSALYKTETDLAWIAKMLGRESESAKYHEASLRRKKAMNRYLWNPSSGRFENYNLRTKKRIHGASGDIFSALFSGVATPPQARQIRKALSILEAKGGIRASNFYHSKHQWDGNNGWAPYQYFAIQGLKNYGYLSDAKRIAGKWVDATANVFDQTSTFFERIDVEKLSKPQVDQTKYPPQSGFLWTNGIFNWALIDVLGAKLEPLHK